MSLIKFPSDRRNLVDVPLSDPSAPLRWPAARAPSDPQRCRRCPYAFFPTRPASTLRFYTNSNPSSPSTCDRGCCPLPGAQQPASAARRRTSADVAPHRQRQRKVAALCLASRVHRPVDDADPWATARHQPVLWDYLTSAEFAFMPARRLHVDPEATRSRHARSRSLARTESRRPRSSGTVRKMSGRLPAAAKESGVHVRTRDVVYSAAVRLVERGVFSPAQPSRTKFDSPQRSLNGVARSRASPRFSIRDGGDCQGTVAVAHHQGDLLSDYDGENQNAWTWVKYAHIAPLCSPTRARKKIAYTS